ncbi:ARM REPEAT SUPERFAMILY PROTEIN [Salix koriyanagi]|uniref:ARM REPEAT SUPERFAMILY PROTEIN n=1 Tax=Salix koriyanagi TaxID=2511006 RepID=A0A9Q0UX10_9ROSI|nr:ARM REPEAT SUPERFAMILY PROTEIN [Salix koriyanagi]
MGQENPKQDQIFQESSPPKRSLRQAIEVISSLISYSLPIKVFAVKWQLIRNKLEELNSSLIAIEDCDSCQNPIVSGMMSAVLASARDCYDLARRCVDLSYSGKLLMQSDLDAMVAKFDRHVRNLSGIFTAGILSQGFAIVVSRPGVNACKDDVRFYVRDLLTRIKIGDLEMKRHALVNLYDVVVEDEKYVKIIVEVGDIVNILVSLLDSMEMELQQDAVKVVAVISGFDSYKSILIGAGIIGPLIRVLESGSEISKEGAARSLQKLTKNSDNACVDSTAELISPACGVLRNLAGVDEIKRFMIEEGAVSTFIKLARSKDEGVQISSIEFLQNIASGDESVRQLVVKEGGIRALVRVFDPKIARSSKSREMALRAIENLCFSSASSISVLMSYGFMDQLLFFLRNGDVSAQELALKAAFRLSGTSEETKKAMGDAGFMSEFVKFLDAKSFEVREMAAVALTSLVSVPKNRKKFVQDDRNVSFLLQLLDQEETNSGSKKLLISILLSLTSCNSGRKQIASSGYLKNIEKLAEAEVSDAKRLVRKLSTNRFRSMLNGIWHS